MLAFPNCRAKHSKSQLQSPPFIRIDLQMEGHVFLAAAARGCGD